MDKVLITQASSDKFRRGYGLDPIKSDMPVGSAASLLIHGGLLLSALFAWQATPRIMPEDVIAVDMVSDTPSVLGEKTSAETAQVGVDTTNPAPLPQTLPPSEAQASPLPDAQPEPRLEPAPNPAPDPVAKPQPSAAELAPPPPVLPLPKPAPNRRSLPASASASASASKTPALPPPPPRPAPLPTAQAPSPTKAAAIRPPQQVAPRPAPAPPPRPAARAMPTAPAPAPAPALPPKQVAAQTLTKTPAKIAPTPAPVSRTGPQIGQRQSAPTAPVEFDLAAAATSASGADSGGRRAPQLASRGQAGRLGKAGGGAQLTGDLEAALRAQIQPCWLEPANMADAGRLLVVVSIDLGIDGRLMRDPVLVTPSSRAGASPSLVVAIDNALRAVRECAPFNLPPDRYESWRQVRFTFDPRRMARS